MAGDLYGDYSRISFAPERRVSTVLSQQGRVILDADINEQAQVLLHYLRTLTTDLVGPYGGPDPGAAFRVETRDSDDPPDLAIGGGRYYVNGILCEVDAGIRFYQQPDTFFDPQAADDRLPDAPYVVYARVWERLVSSIENDTLREVALGIGGPDTVTRQRVVWQVLASSRFPWGGAVNEMGRMTRDDVLREWGDWVDVPPAQQPLLRARSRRPAGTDDEPCITPPSARYRGAENQLYRVEIHSGSDPGPATFKWSRDNGSAIHPLITLSGSKASVVSLGRDRWSSLDVGDWVEFVDDRTAVRRATLDRPWVPESLRRVMDVDPLERMVTLDAAPVAVLAADRHPFLRRWDQEVRPAAAGAPQLVENDNSLRVVESDAEGEGWLELEDGVEIQFRAAAKGNPARRYRSGDYWLIPARTATGDIEWPGESDSPEALPPHGIDYAYAPLAIVDGPGQVRDLRLGFPPLSVSAPTL